VLALLRLLPGGDRDKDIAILSLRHQVVAGSTAASASANSPSQLTYHDLTRNILYDPSRRACVDPHMRRVHYRGHPDLPPKMRGANAV
jgi:hypothetical protein